MLPLPGMTWILVCQCLQLLGLAQACLLTPTLSSTATDHIGQYSALGSPIGSRRCSIGEY